MEHSQCAANGVLIHMGANRTSPRNLCARSVRCFSSRKVTVLLLTKISKGCLPFVLLIVMAGLPSCQQTRYRLNEVGAQSSLRLIRKAETTYRSQDRENRFGTLQELHLSGLIDTDLASGAKNGYRFDVRVGKDSFAAIATPQEYDVTGSWSYYLDESGVIRANVTKGRLPGVNDAPIKDQ